MQAKTVLITGATSGLGAAMAERCAAPGVTLHLCGRHEERLRAVAARCAAVGANVNGQLIDVRDRAAMARWIGAIGPVELAIANAGISAGTMGAAVEAEDQVRGIFDINVTGVFNTVLPLLASMQRQQPDRHGVRGRIGVVASIAGLIAMPGAPSYCASKAAVDRWAVATAPQAWAQGVRLTSLCPGYIRTPMTDANDFPMPGMMEVDVAAHRLLDAVERGVVRYATPAWFAAVAKVGNLLPPSLLNRIASRSVGKAPASAL